MRPPRNASPLHAILRLTGACLAALSTVLPVGEARAGEAGEGIERFYHPFPAEDLGTIAGAAPEHLQLLPPRLGEGWPQLLLETLAARVRDEWQAGTPYGLVRSGIPLFLRYPLVTARVGEEVLVPVLDSQELQISGLVPVPVAAVKRSVVVLLDASSSANTAVQFRDPNGHPQTITVLEAERRALDHLLGLIQPGPVQLGLIAFGETTEVIAAPGTDIPQARAGLAAHRRARPTGEGRTDMLCALWLAREWLDDAPSGHTREIVLMTDGDLPHSGRFVDCSFARRRGGDAGPACEARRNPHPCPAAHRFRDADGRSDIVQLASFARRSRRAATVHPLVFEDDRPSRIYRELAFRTRGRFSQVHSAGAIEAALPALVTRRVREVYAVNRGSGERTADLYDPTTGRFDGHLPLEPGANDVELRVLGERGPAAIARFRIYAEGQRLERTLADLRERSRSLEGQVESLLDETRAAFVDPGRDLEVTPETPPASLD